jgi:hypothetical protein
MQYNTHTKMEEPKQGHPHTDYKHDSPSQKPYWKRFHYDWKFWAAILLMLIAMAVYVGTYDLSFRPNSPPQQRTP